eukprot:204332-Prorocentrum_minimum.AAC.1
MPAALYEHIDAAMANAASGTVGLATSMCQVSSEFSYAPSSSPVIGHTAVSMCQVSSEFLYAPSSSCPAIGHKA